jgi:Raf kinase inhibitor-like YbhB/YbcL family protein
MSLQLTSPAIKPNKSIPVDYTADGKNVSPPLKWTGIPPGTKSFALLCEDPDAPRGTFTHWVVCNVPAEASELVEAALPRGAVQGENSFGEAAYGGPSPPPGQPHHYHFKLYALDTSLTLIGHFSAEGLKSEMQGHILGEADLVGLYQRTAR